MNMLSVILLLILVIIFEELCIFMTAKGKKYYCSDKKFLVLLVVELTVYLLGYVYVTFGNRAANIRRTVNVFPGAVIFKIIGFSSGYSGFYDFVKSNGVFQLPNRLYFNIELLIGMIFNILLYIPFGFLLLSLQSTLNSTKKDISGQILLFGILSSILTELLQYISALGWFDIDDIILNTIGCSIGIYIYKKILAK